MSAIKAALDETFELPEVVTRITHAKWHAERHGGDFNWTLFYASLTETIGSHEAWCQTCEDNNQAAYDAAEAKFGDDWADAFSAAFCEYVETYLPIAVAA